MPSRAAGRSAALCILAVTAVLATPALANGNTDELTEARSLAQNFQQYLKQALMKAMSEGGPQNAIGVCNIEAPRIAATLSARSRWRVARTGLKVRNPDNAPTPREEAILKQFQQALADGASPKTLETASIAETADGRMLHYMKAIPTAEICTTCHGENVDPELLKTIREIYPKDEAVGFRPGELRGAFTFYKPLAAE